MKPPSYYVAFLTFQASLWGGAWACYSSGSPYPAGLLSGVAICLLVGGVMVWADGNENRPETLVGREDEGPDPGNYCCQCSSPYVVFDEAGEKQCGDCGKPLIPF